MSINKVENYDEEKKKFLLSLWKKILKHLYQNTDVKKIASFLNKCWIIWIDEKEQKIIIWVPNEFIASQVKKFFKDKLDESIQEIYNPQFAVEIKIYKNFQSWKHNLQTDINKLLWIKTNKQTISTKKYIDSSTKEKLKDFFGVLFDSRYQFEKFIIGENNKLAYSAAKQVSENPWKAYNPLFLYWNVGLWKTHLLQSIANTVLQKDSDKVVVYLPTTKLIDEIIESIRKNKLSSLMKKLEWVDILILDDIQFLAKKEKTQEIFHNIFNEFHMKKKQIVLSSDRPPKELNLLEARLRSRFALWLVTDIKQPDFETRMAIIKSKLSEKWEELSKDLIELIAKYVKDNIRELEGALNLILTKEKLLWKEITQEEVIESLETLWYNIERQNTNFAKINQANWKNQNNQQNFQKIIEYVANYFNISSEDIKWNSRKREISIARQMLMYIAKNNFWRTLEKIWELFWGKNHASVLYSIKNFEKKLNTCSKTHNDFYIILEENWL